MIDAKRFSIMLDMMLEKTEPNLNNIQVGSFLAFRYAPTNDENVVDNLVIFTGNGGRRYIEGLSLFEMPVDKRNAIAGIIYQAHVKAPETANMVKLKVLREITNSPTTKKYVKRYIISRIDKSGVRLLNSKTERIVLA